jgi:hypothetical protein
LLEMTKNKRKCVQMTPAVRKAVSGAKYWYRPAAVAVLSPFSVVLLLNNNSFKLTLPWFLTHPVSLVYMACISLAFIWIRHRRIIAAIVLLLVFVFGGNCRRREINNIFRRG